MDDSVLLNMLYEIYVEAFPQKRKQKRKNKRRRRLSSEQLYYEFKSLKEFCRKIKKREVTLEILQGLTQNLETSLNYKVRKRANLVNTILRIAIFLITGIAFVFSWTFLADELPYSDRPDFLTIITNVTVIAGSIVLGSLIYFQDEGFKEEEDFLSILKDAQIIMKKDSSV